MGFLDFIRKPQVKEYTLKEAMGVIENDLISLKSKSAEQSYQDALKAFSEIGKLIEFIEEFSSKPAPELGKSSEGVKERFCSLARKQLSSLSAPDKSRPDEFLQSSRLIMGSLGGLTQRQILHINFFFKEDFRHVAKKINEINSLLSQQAEASDHQKAASIYRKLAQLSEQKYRLGQSIIANDEKLLVLEDSRRTLPELAKKPDTHRLGAAEGKLRAIKQEIDSFLAIQKTLKKYAYAAEAKDRLLTSYIESPSNALMQDAGLKIMDFAAAASEMAGKGSIENDKKLDVVTDSLDYLKSKRNELVHAAEEVRQGKEKYSAELQVFESSIKERTNRMAEIEGELKNTEKSIKMENDDVQRIDKEIAGARAELLLLASKILDANVM